MCPIPDKALFEDELCEKWVLKLWNCQMALEIRNNDMENNTTYGWNQQTCQNPIEHEHHFNREKEHWTLDRWMNYAQRKTKIPDTKTNGAPAFLL